MQKGANSYFKTQVTTTSRGDVLIMLYDGAIKFLQQAKEKIAAKDPAAKGLLISKALDILNELDSTLNLEKGGELAANLHNLYFFCNTRLLMANLKMDSNIIDEVIKILSGLRSAYAEINAQPEIQSMVSQEAPIVSAPTRIQSGTSSTGTIATPITPGANLRRQTQYNRTMMDATSPAAQSQATSLVTPPVDPLSSVAAPLTDPLKPVAAPESHKPLAPQATPMPTPVTKVPDTLLPSGPAMGTSFSRKGLSGSHLYKKFAANQQ